MEMITDKVEESVPLHPSQGEFLNILAPSDQRTCLGRHATYCKRTQEAFIANKLLEKSILKFLKKNPKSNEKKQVRIKELEAKNLPDNMVQRGVATSSNNADVGGNHHHVAADNIDSDDEEYQKILAPIYINEPHILRVSIYEKYLLQYQHLYNLQAIPEMIKLLIKPIWSYDIIRENTLSYTMPSTSMIPIVAINSLITEDRHSYQGIENFHVILEMIFRKLPDSMLIYHNSKILYKPDMGRTFVITPFSIFGILTMSQYEMNKIDGINEDSTNHLLTTNSTVEKQTKKRRLNQFSSIDLHFSGTSVLVFNDDNNKVVLKSDSYYIDKAVGAEPSLSPDKIWKYLCTVVD